MMSDDTLASCTFCGETGITFPHTCKPEETGELPWTVDAERIRELLLDMHEPNCSGDGCEGENSCPACLCRHALYRLTRNLVEVYETYEDEKANRITVVKSPRSDYEREPHLCSRCEIVHVLPRFGEPDRCPVNRFKPYEALDAIRKTVLGLTAENQVDALRAYITGMEQ